MGEREYVGGSDGIFSIYISRWLKFSFLSSAVHGFKFTVTGGSTINYPFVFLCLFLLVFFLFLFEGADLYYALQSCYIPGTQPERVVMVSCEYRILGSWFIHHILLPICLDIDLPHFLVLARSAQWKIELVKGFWIGRSVE